jgi:hypothetical protein
LGKRCPDCKYYPKPVQEAVEAHEEQHRKDTRSLAGFFRLLTKNGRKAMEMNAYDAELAVETRHIERLERFVGPLSETQQQTLTILRTMRDQAQGVVLNPDAYKP